MTSTASSAETGILYLVATPIGNLEDITLRALRLLKEVDLVAAEDTRHSRKLFAHFGITTPLTAYHEHNETAKAGDLLELLRQGRSLALISDAGTPGVADPGYRLVRACRAAGVEVRAVPGPAAVTAALSVSGLPSDRFAFEGFLPARSKGRRERLRMLREESRTLVCYEAPHRIAATLRDLVEAFGGEREIAVARELTKLHEELLRGTVAEVLAELEHREKVRGEIVLVIAPAPPKNAEPGPLEDVLRQRLAGDDRPPRAVVKEVARELEIPGSRVYEAYLRLKDEAQE